jgi:hypothetical protein
MRAISSSVLGVRGGSSSVLHERSEREVLGEGGRSSREGDSSGQEMLFVFVFGSAGRVSVEAIEAAVVGIWMGGGAGSAAGEGKGEVEAEAEEAERYDDALDASTEGWSLSAPRFGGGGGGSVGADGGCELSSARSSMASESEY